MISEQQCKQIIDTALAHGSAKCEGLEVHVFASDVATSRFANNGMTQNQSPQSIGVSVRVIADGRQARLSSDRISDDGIKQLVDNAIAVAQLLEKDPDVLPLYTPESGDAQTVSRYDLQTANLTPMDRANAINSIIAVANKHGLSAAGVYASGTNVQAVGNSSGLFAYHKESTAECSITMSAPDSTGWAKADSPRAGDMDVQAMAESAAQKALASANPVELEPGHYTVILEPSAVLDLLGFLWYDFAGTSHLDKLSCFLDKLGQKVLGENISINDDVYHPLQSGAAFDGEGVPRQPLSLVDKGIIKNLVYGRLSAKKCCVNSTGHGLMQPSGQGEYPVNVVVAGGDRELSEMIKGAKHAILLTRVWYVREVDPTKKIVTGMTRDGTFLVEDGQIKHGVKNFRFNQSLIEMLNQVMALGLSVRTAGEESFPAVVPAMLVENFNFSSVTKF